MHAYGILKISLGVKSTSLERVRPFRLIRKKNRSKSALVYNEFAMNIVLFLRTRFSQEVASLKCFFLSNYKDYITRTDSESVLFLKLTAFSSFSNRLQLRPDNCGMLSLIISRWVLHQLRCTVAYQSRSRQRAGVSPWFIDISNGLGMLMRTVLSEVGRKMKINEKKILSRVLRHYVRLSVARI